MLLIRALNCLSNLGTAGWLVGTYHIPHTTHPGHCSHRETKAIVMFGDSHHESQRCLSLQSPHVPGLPSTHRSTLTQDAPPNTDQPSCLGSHISYLLPAPISLTFTDLQGEGVGQQSLSFIDQEGQGLKANIPRNSILSWNFGL